MNILILHSSSDLYGASKILISTVEVFNKNGHEVLVVLTEDGPLVRELQQMGANVVFIRLGILRRKYKTPLGILNRLWVMRKAYFSIKQLIQQKNITLVYSNTTAVLMGAFVAKKLNIKHIWHVHEILENPKWLYRFLGWTLNKFSTKVIVVSEAVKKSWGKYVEVKKLQLIYSGIDYSPYFITSHKLKTTLGIKDEVIVIGMIGRVHFWKGQDYFLQIAAELNKRISGVNFVMIGDAFPGNEFLYEKINHLIKVGNLESVVIDLGYRSDVSELLQGFDIFILPSTLPDPFPTVLLEAMASAIPVIATRQGGAMEMIEENISGCFIELNAPFEASLQIEKLIHNKALRKQLGEAGRKKVMTSYSADAFEKKMLKILE